MDTLIAVPSDQPGGLDARVGAHFGHCEVYTLAKIDNGEVFVHQMHIGPYPFASYDNHDPLRPRKLLLHRYEIKRLTGKVNEKGYALIPLNVYFKSGKVKLTLALAKGKRLHDKRETIRQRDEKRDLERSRKEGY